MRNFLMLIVAVTMVGCVAFAGCATIFPESEPLCTVEEQESSVVYKVLKKLYSNPRSANFTLLMGTATQIQKHPETKDEIIELAKSLKTAILEGITYELFAEKALSNLGPYQYLVASEALTGFKAYKIPIKSECDVRLIFAHLDKQIKLVEMQL